MRIKGSKTNKKCWSVVITQGDIELHNKEYTTLKEAGNDLGLSYSQICELGPNGRNKKRAIHFKFMPDIKITKLNKKEEPVNELVESLSEEDLEKLKQMAVNPSLNGFTQ
tara:strand:+ start:4889 stop:5218 length:330 start_codon:yes stop_codon:yes gene_type:complete